MTTTEAFEPKKIVPGSELHFALLGVPMGWNFLTGKDYADMQAFAKAVWDAATERAAKLVESGPPPLKVEGGRIEIGERARKAFAAAIRAREDGVAG